MQKVKFHMKYEIFSVISQASNEHVTEIVLIQPISIRKVNVHYYFNLKLSVY